MLNVTLCVVLPLHITSTCTLLSCTGTEEDSNDNFSDDYEVITMQEEADGGDNDDDDDGDDDDQESEGAMGTNFALTSNKLGINYTWSY